MKDVFKKCCGNKRFGYFPTAIVCAFFATITLMVSFSSPNWLASYSETNSEFVRLGLWTACFRQYSHHNHQFDEKFHGCHWIFGYKFRNLRKWLQPEWMVFVQTVMSCGVVFSVIALTLRLLLLMQSLSRLRVCVLAMVFILESITALLGFLGVSVFGGMCFDRSWIQYPNYNHLSWGYMLATISCLLHGAVAALVLIETFYIRKHLYHTSVIYETAVQKERIATQEGVC